jgi:hypothetical protein
MVWGWEYIAGFDVFQYSALHIVSQMVFLFIFGYLGARGEKEKPYEVAIEIVAYSMLGEFALALLGLPPLFVAIGFIAIYLFVAKYVLKIEGLTHFSFFAVYIAFIFSELALIDDMSRILFIGFAIVLMFLFSEIRTKTKKKEAPKK